MMRRRSLWTFVSAECLRMLFLWELQISVSKPLCFCQNDVSLRECMLCFFSKSHSHVYCLLLSSQNSFVLQRTGKTNLDSRLFDAWNYKTNPRMAIVVLRGMPNNLPYNFLWFLKIQGSLTNPSTKSKSLPHTPCKCGALDIPCTWTQPFVNKVGPRNQLYVELWGPYWLAVFFFTPSETP